MKPLATIRTHWRYLRLYLHRLATDRHRRRLQQRSLMTPTKKGPWLDTKPRSAQYMDSLRK